VADHDQGVEQRIGRTLSTMVPAVPGSSESRLTPRLLLLSWAGTVVCSVAPQTPSFEPNSAASVKPNWSHIFRHDKRCAVIACEHGVGFGVVLHLQGFGIELEGAAEAIGDVGQVHKFGG